MLNLTIVIFLLCSINLIPAKIFDGYCPSNNLATFHKCDIGKDFFSSQNLSTETNAYQVIARMEFEQLKGITMFYTIFKENLVATISPRERKFSIDCRAGKSLTQGAFLTFKFMTESGKNCNRAVTNGSTHQIEDLDLREFMDVARPTVIYFTRTKDFLAIWRCDEIPDQTHDLAAWVLSSNISIIMHTKDELKNQLKIFLRQFNGQIDFQLAEEDFEVPKLNLDKNACKVDFRPGTVSKIIKSDLGLMKNETIFKLHSAHGKTTIALIFFTALMTFVGVFITTAKFFINRISSNDDTPLFVVRYVSHQPNEEVQIEEISA